MKIERLLKLLGASLGHVEMIKGEIFNHNLEIFGVWPGKQAKLKAK